MADRDGGSGGGSGAARRRRERRLRAHWRHEQLSLRMLLASVGHHSWQSKTSVGVQTDWEEESDKGNYAKGQKTPPLAGTQYFTMTPEDDVSVPEPCGGRSAVLQEPRPQGGAMRHCGSGFELVLNAKVPQMEREVVEERFSVLRAVHLLELERDPGGGDLGEQNGEADRRAAAAQLPEGGGLDGGGA